MGDIVDDPFEAFRQKQESKKEEETREPEEVSAQQIPLEGEEATDGKIIRNKYTRSAESEADILDGFETINKKRTHMEDTEKPDAFQKF